MTAGSEQYLAEYKSEANGTAPGEPKASWKKQALENIKVCGCETRVPTRTTLVYVAVIVGTGILAIIVGHVSAHDTLQSIQSYSLEVKNEDGEILSMINAVLVFNTAAFYLPGKNFASLSQTQTIYDFDTKWRATLIIPEEERRGKRFCYLRPFNTTKMGSYEMARETVSKGGSVVKMNSSIMETGWDTREIFDSEVSRLGSYIRSRCLNHVMLVMVYTDYPTIGRNCTEHYIPQYALQSRIDRNVVCITEISRIPSFCVVEMK